MGVNGGGVRHLFTLTMAYSLGQPQFLRPAVTGERPAGRSPVIRQPTPRAGCVRIRNTNR